MRPTEIDRADVYKGGRLAAYLTRTSEGVEFRYTPDWIADAGVPVATTLPVDDSPVVAPGGAVPAYFAGLLPEGRRLSALRRIVKTSADDELSLLLAVGTDPVGDVQVVPEGHTPVRATARLQVERFDEVDFAEVLATYDITLDRVGLAGVQDKASLAMLSVPLSTAGASWILKLDPPEHPRLADNEAFFLDHAVQCRVAAAQARLVHDRKGRSGLLVTRFDRVAGAAGVEALAVEDGCQVLGLHPEGKYRRTTEDVVSALVRVCAAPLPAAAVFLRQSVYAYVTGNGDAHAKNFSVVADSSGRFAPAPAYDLPSTYPYGDHTIALTVEGRRDGNITGARFVSLGMALGLRERAARRAVTETADGVGGWLDELDRLPYDAGVLRKLRRIIERRRRLLLEH